MFGKLFNRPNDSMDDFVKEFERMTKLTPEQEALIRKEQEKWEAQQREEERLHRRMEIFKTLYNGYGYKDTTPITDIMSGKIDIAYTAIFGDPK